MAYSVIKGYRNPSEGIHESIIHSAVVLPSQEVEIKGKKIENDILSNQRFDG
jgi:hypothetical protein